MVKHAKPVVHARDHEHGGADPHRIHYESVGESGPAGITLDWIAAKQEDLLVDATSFDYLDFFAITTPAGGITSGDSITIATAGTWIVQAAGEFGYGSSTVQAQLQLELNGGSHDTGEDYARALFATTWTGDGDPLTFSPTVSLLDWVGLDVGDIVKFRARNYGTFPLLYHAWRVLMLRLT